MMAIVFIFTSCNKSVKCPPQEIIVECAREIDVVKVKATIQFMQNPNDDCPWTLYEIASCKYQNDKFELTELNIPKTVQDEYLSSIPENEINVVSDIEAKTASLDIKAYNISGNYIGKLYLSCDNWNANYRYADRSFSKKGSINVGTNSVEEYDCSYEEGWNIEYISYGQNMKITTQKPLNEDFKWHFRNICPD